MSALTRSVKSRLPSFSSWLGLIHLANARISVPRTSANSFVKHGDLYIRPTAAVVRAISLQGIQIGKGGISFSCIRSCFFCRRWEASHSAIHSALKSRKKVLALLARAADEMSAWLPAADALDLSGEAVDAYFF